MTIDQISAYAISFPFVGGGFSTSYGRRTALANVLLAIRADGRTGYGEVAQPTGKPPSPQSEEELLRARRCLGALVGAAAGDCAGVRDALGDAPLNLHHAVQTALLDLMAQRAGEPLVNLLGGRRSHAMPVYLSVSSDTPEVMARAMAVARQQGVARFQIKLDGKADADAARVHGAVASLRQGETILADANGAYDLEGAKRLVAALPPGAVMIEEPCAGFDDNVALARMFDRPFILDQCLLSLEHYARAVAEGCLHGVVIKPTLLGGLQAGLVARELCTAAGLAMRVDDSWTGDVGSVAALHLAAGTPDNLLLSTLDMRDYFSGRMFSGGPVTCDGRISVPDDAGLGLAVLPPGLGVPIFELR